MENVVIIDEREWRTRNYTLVCVLLLGVITGYFLAMVYPVAPKPIQHPSSPVTAMEKWVALSIQQAKPGDYAITKDGEVFRLGSSNRKAVVEGDYVYYNTRMTSGGYHKKQLWQMTGDTVAVIDPTHSKYFGVDQCFYKGKVVTTVGPEKLTC
jgi:hypothetical protein